MNLSFERDESLLLKMHRHTENRCVSCVILMFLYQAHRRTEKMTYNPDFDFGAIYIYRFYLGSVQHITQIYSTQVQFKISHRSSQLRFSSRYQVNLFYLGSVQDVTQIQPTQVWFNISHRSSLKKHILSHLRTIVILNVSLNKL